MVENVNNVRAAIASLGIPYPVAIDNDYAIWRAFNNQYWPAHYFIDAKGQIRHHHFGEGDYDGSERVIQQLLAEAGGSRTLGDLVPVSGSGVEASPDMGEVQSPETYIGYERTQNFISPGGVVKDTRHVYTAAKPRLNEWSVSGTWTIKGEHADLNGKDGSIIFRFHSRDLHLVLGPAADGKPVRFKVTIDDAAPGESHGTNIDADGQGVVTGHRLYQLVRQKSAIADHTFAIKFLDPGVQAFAFTFG